MSSFSFSRVYSRIVCKGGAHVKLALMSVIQLELHACRSQFTTTCSSGVIICAQPGACGAVLSRAASLANAAAALSKRSARSICLFLKLPGVCTALDPVQPYESPQDRVSRLIRDNSLHGGIELRGPQCRGGHHSSYRGCKAFARR